MEAFGGYFVVINEDRHEGFKKKVYMYVNSTFYIHIWCLSDKFTLKDHACTCTWKNIFSNISITSGHILQMDVW